ncbi:hypothetical protein NM688_g1183 [Phlebia brevispora]|uniref:Uncharacterized protein n=1 Tax=Phlebia brevispora TaxID=194682 RepID=A0ACC1TBX6_9APHY|nr:hypothetical protein NM688_g1183 [Phlebia brevispora]
MMLSPLILVVSLFAFVSAKPQARRAEMTLHEYIANIPSGFVDNGPADPNSVLDLRIALVQNNKDGIIEALNNITTLGHPSYGQHLTQEEAASFLAPTSETVSAVNAWLQNAGLNATATTSIGDWLRLNTTVSVANELLAANFSLFTHTETGEQSIRTLNYSIPANLAGHLDFVHPTISFPAISASQAAAATIVARAPNYAGFDPNACGANLVTPRCIQRLHGVPADMVPARQPPAPGVSIGVTGLNNQFANREDLVTFLQHYRPDIVAPQAKTFDLKSVNGGQNTQTLALAGSEANLDIQYTVGIATGVPTTFYSVGLNAASYYEDLVNYLQTQPVPGVLTTSYGGPEYAFSEQLANRLCTAYAALGTRGVSVIYSTGDDGVGRVDPATNQCHNNRFVPVFPASCPFVTAVGATSIQAVPHGVVGLYQEGAHYSGGGFSEYFDNTQSDWQAPAVQSYLRNIYPQYDGGKFRSVGRAFPDVSAVGTNIATDWRGAATMTSGTSASAPIFASMIALINAARAEAGKGPLGFLNRFLYENPGAFEDIRQGSNPGCNTPGFPALPGWDPVTGLGTPNFNALKAAAVARP